VLSRKLTPRALLETARGHWQIENSLHWQLDVSFGEDAARNRKDNGPANIAVIGRRALDVARLEQSKGSLTEKLKRAGWNDEFTVKCDSPAFWGGDRLDFFGRITPPDEVYAIDAERRCPSRASRSYLTR